MERQRYARHMQQKGVTMVSPPWTRHARRVHVAVEGEWLRGGLGASARVLSLEAKHFKDSDPEL